MVNYKRIKKDCFWDESFTEDDIKKTSTDGTYKEKAYLFQKILLNSSMLFEDIKLFNSDDLKTLVENYKLPQFNRNFAFKRKNLIEVYFFNKPLLVEELKWIE